MPKPPPPSLASDEPGFRSLVTIQRGNENLIPFFCIHGSGGNVLNFRDLSQAMGRSQPFYGLQSRGIDGESQTHRSIEEMATAYLKEIRDIQPQGPYMLGGYSGGGLVAFEMAQQLSAAGEDIALLVMFDTFPPQIPDRDITVAMRLGWLRDERMGYIKKNVMRRVQARRDAEELRRAEDIAARGGVVPVELRDMYVQHSFMRAADSYVLRPWSWPHRVDAGRRADLRSGRPGPDLRLGRGGCGRRRGHRGERQPRHLRARLERVHARPAAADDARPHAGPPRRPLTSDRPPISGGPGHSAFWARSTTKLSASRAQNAGQDATSEVATAPGNAARRRREAARRAATP